MLLSPEQIHDIARMARLTLDDVQTQSIAHDFERILSYIDTIRSGEASEAESYPVLLKNVMRDDVATLHPGLYADDILAGAPDTIDRYVKVRKVLGS